VNALYLKISLHYKRKPTFKFLYRLEYLLKNVELEMRGRP